MRYTETRLAPIAHECFLEEIGSDTVNYSNNFDGSQQEPDVLTSTITFFIVKWIIRNCCWNGNKYSSSQSRRNSRWFNCFNKNKDISN